MSVHPPDAFLQMQEDLTALLLNTVASYALGRGLEAFSSTALSQMSLSIRDAAAEALMFGCNAWPIPRAEMESGNEPPPSAEIIPFLQMAS